MLLRASRKLSVYRFCMPQVCRFFSSNGLNPDGELLNEWLRGTNHKQPVKWDQVKFETIAIDSAPSGVFNIKLNRPSKMNAFNMQMWVDLEDVFQKIEIDKAIKVVVLSGEGRCFSTGMDLNVFASMQKELQKEACEGRKREQLSHVIQKFQDIISAPEHCRVPVLAAVHGMCLGGAVDFITSCDLRYCDNAAEFSIKEIDLAIVADIGTLQRLPKLIGEQQAKELAYTGRHFYGTEAVENGLVLKSFPDKEALFRHVNAVANDIAKKSPLTIRGIKKTVNYQRDHSTVDSLHQIKQWNAAMLYSEDLGDALSAMSSKTSPTFRND